MKVLIGCEESGVIRRAARAAGHDAWSNDLLPARDGDEHHYQCDVFEALEKQNWDIIILHPPCTALSLSGNGTYGTGMVKHEQRIIAGKWSKELWDKAKLKAPKVALENPLSMIWKAIGESPQYIQPWMFGHPEQKKTGFALYNLPRLVATNNVYVEMMKLPKHKRERINYMSPSPMRAMLRSETFTGIADAIVAQWMRADT